MKRMLLLLVFFSISGSLFSQKEMTDICIGKTFLFDSKILNESRRIFVSLPDNYLTAPHSVVYLIASVQNDFRTNILHQQFITIGIESKDTKQDFLKASNRDNFSLFLEKELIPYVEANYKTLPVRFLSGHSLSGGFAIDVFLKKNQLFSFYIATSPTLHVLDSIQIQELKLEKETGLYFNMGGHEQYEQLEKANNNFYNQLKVSKVNHLNWKFEKLEGETHETNEYTGFCRGYCYYKSLMAIPDSILGLNIHEIINYTNNLNASFGSGITVDDNVIMPNILISLKAKNYLNLVDAVNYISERLPDLFKEELNDMIEIGKELQRNNQSKYALRVFKIIFDKTGSQIAGEKIKELEKGK